LLVDIAEAEAHTIAVPMAIAVADAEGGLQLFKRMDGTLPVSTELAASKAFTAAVLRMSSAQVGELAKPGAPLFGIESTHGGRIVLFGGGLPLRLNGQVVGAVGVSGGIVEEDLRVAGAAVEGLHEMECRARSFRELLPGAIVESSVLAKVKEEVCLALERCEPPLAQERIAVIVGAVCLALTQTG